MLKSKKKSFYTENKKKVLGWYLNFREDPNQIKAKKHHIPCTKRLLRFFMNVTNNKNTLYFGIVFKYLYKRRNSAIYLKCQPNFQKFSFLNKQISINFKIK